MKTSMRTSFFRKTLCGMVLWLTVIMPAHADVVFRVELDTTSLISHIAAPFSLNFQLIDGSGTGNGNNTVTLSNFVFGGGGSASGNPQYLGNVVGNLGGTVQLTDTNFFNDFAEEFVPGMGRLSFDVRVTTNANPDNDPADTFSFALLDATGAELPVLGTGDALLLIDLDGPMPLIQTFGTDPDRSPVAGGPTITLLAPTVTIAPEPGTFGLAGLGGATLGNFLRRRRPVTKV